MTWLPGRTWEFEKEHKELVEAEAERLFGTLYPQFKKEYIEKFSNDESTRSVRRVFLKHLIGRRNYLHPSLGMVLPIPPINHAKQDTAILEGLGWIEAKIGRVLSSEEIELYKAGFLAGFNLGRQSK